MNPARVALFVVLLSLLPNTWAARVLIIHGTGQLAVQNAHPSTDTVELQTSIPDEGTLAGFDEVWDLRGLSLPGLLSEAEITAYRNYLALGKALVVLGEHNSGCSTPEPCFKPRNDSILNLIEVAGGGQLAYATAPGSPNVGGIQTVQSPFTGPNPIANNDVNFGTAAGVATPGTGQFIAIDPITGGGSALVFARGSLDNAPAGTLIVVFDQNWLGSEDADETNLLRNIVSFLPASAAPGPAISTALSGLVFPLGAALHAGQLYIADREAHTVWRFDPAAPSLTPVAGTGTVASQTVSGGQLIVTLNPGVAGFSGDGTATAAMLNGPSGVAVDASGNVFIADTENNVIRKVTPDGLMSTVAGKWPERSSAPNLLAGPRGLAVDGSGNLYIADTLNNQVKKLDAATGQLSVVAGIAGVTGPVQKDCAPGPTVRLNAPLGVAVFNSASGPNFVYIAEEGNGAIRYVDANTLQLCTYTGNLGAPAGVALDPNGNLYVTQANRHIVTLFADGSSTVAGTLNDPGATGDGGSPTLAKLNTPVGIVVDAPVGASRTLYIVDLVNKRIRKVVTP